jgi:Holliday junction resolvase-like predicted endonuclease
MTELTTQLRSDVYRWPTDDIIAKQNESLRLVRVRMRQATLDGYVPSPATVTTTDKVRRQLLRLRKAWSACQRDRNRDAIYKYLGDVYEVVARWRDQGQVASRVRRVRMLLQNTTADLDPYALLIVATSDAKTVDRKIRSKWCRVLRLAERYKPGTVSLKAFIKGRGGINACAAQYARRGRNKNLDEK